MWKYVVPHFEGFLANLELTPAQRTDGNTKALNVAQCLHAHYYGGQFDRGCALLVGSFGKNTATRPKTDIDLLFILPPALLPRVQQLQGNKQSQLLQDIRLVLVNTFSQTKELSADGQVVQVPFQSYELEVIPAFYSQDNVYLTCNTHNGGSWRLTNPTAEGAAIHAADQDSAYKATHLIKMLKAWKRECNVPLKSLALEIAAVSFTREWTFKKRSLFWYDWMIRDFFYYLLRFPHGNAHIPGITEQLPLGNEWVTKCERAYRHALRACYHESLDLWHSAEQEWKAIFGDLFPALLPQLGLRSPL